MTRLVGELRDRREISGVSQRALSRELGRSQSELARLESLAFPDVPLTRLAEIAALLGLELSASLHPLGDPIRDKGHQALIGRFRSLVADGYVIRTEVPLPHVGDPRSWDLLLRLDDLLVGIEAETRIRDVQALVRHVRRRERDGGVDEILIVLSRTRVNGELVDGLRSALGERFSTPPRNLLAALRAGRPLSGSGVIMV